MIFLECADLSALFPRRLDAARLQLNSIQGGRDRSRPTKALTGQRTPKKLSRTITTPIFALAIVGCLIAQVVGQTFQSVPFYSFQRQAGITAKGTSRSIANNWGLPANLAGELVRYPKENVAFICGPQLKAASPLNPFSWFDATAREQGIAHGEKAPRVAPIGPMNTDSSNRAWRNVIAGRVSIAARGAVVTGKGTRFARDIDAAGPAPGYNGHLRIRDAAGVVRVVKMRSVESDTSLTLTAPWPFASVSNTVADTYYHEDDFGANTDHYFSANYYDTALVQYINYYRTGDQRFLDYARKTADAWWHSVWIGDGTIVDGDTHLPPRAMAYGGLMLRALDGRPEMWDYIERQVRYSFDDWVYKRKNNPALYYDIRDDGYAQLYAVLLAKVLPDNYGLYANGTLAARTGTATDGAAKRATYLSQTEDTAVNFFGRLQWADGSWRWNEDGDKPDDKLRNIEQPFMVGLYLESVILLHQLTRNATVKANLAKQLTRSVRHLYVDAFQRNNRVTDLPNTRWRSMFYFWGGGSVVNPNKFNPPPPKTKGDREAVAAARHFQSTIHHAFGYAYYLTGDESFKQMGDDVFEASFGDRVDGIHCLAASGKAKDYDMNYRASGRYLVWRLAKTASRQSALPSVEQSAAQSVALSPSPRQLSHGDPGSSPTVREGVDRSQPTSAQLVSSALLLARQLSTDLTNKEQIETLITQIEDARRVLRTERKQPRLSPPSQPSDDVIDELQAALAHARTALTMTGSATGGFESAKLRLGWAAARLKRADAGLKPRLNGLKPQRSLNN